MTTTRLPLPVAVAPATRLPVAVAALIGLLSMVAGLATGHLVGGLISPTASPFLAVGASAIDLTPLWLKDFAVRAFGNYDKVVLLSGMAVVVGLVGMAAGLLSRRSRTPGLVLLVALGALASVAVLSRPTAGSLDVLAPLVALLTSGGTFVALHDLGRRSQQPAQRGSGGVSRRTLFA
ncbi:MAG: molybdopterin-binding protein, partial [Pseudonocardiaceae bacterium]